MFITKKNFQKAIDEAVAKAVDQERKEQYEREEWERMYCRVNNLENKVHRVEQKLNFETKDSSMVIAKKVLNESISD